MKHTKKWFSLLLAALLLSSGLTACGDAESTETVSADTSSAAETNAETETEKLTPDLPDSDFEGYEFSILTRGQYNSHWSSQDAYAEELTGEPINDAVYNRNAAIGEKFNFTIKEEIGESVDPDASVTKAVQAGDDIYDMLLIGGVSNGNLATNKLLVDLEMLPYMDLTKPWYDQSANASLSIGNKLYMTSGDLNIMDNNATWIILFSKTLAEQLIDENVYDMASEGTWTLDKMKEFTENASVDLNGDGVLDDSDQWALSGEGFNTMALIEGCGGKAFAKDENDMPYIAMQDENFYDMFLLALSVNGDKNRTMLADNISSKYTDVWSECINKAFSEDRTLFMCTGLNRVSMLREMESDFGLLPIPKYTEEQEAYHCLVSIWASNMISVPKTAGNLERTSIIIEALSAESKYTLTPAYYDITLKTKSARDEESSAMLDLIFEGRAFELGNMYSWGGLFNVVSSLTTTGNTDLASQVESKVASTETAMQKTVDAFIGE
ncbi:MAG: hypothetical protein IJ480_04135 [Clostridia bacterium]|nr:hypothetical protein [Clostridia bacterium]